MKVLVTGATGFVGSYLVPTLIEKGYEVKCLVRSEEKGKKLQEQYHVELWIGDVTKAETIRGIAEGIDYVIHLAAMGHISAVSEEAYNLFVGINEGGTKNLIQEFAASNQLKKFVHFSSTAAMGPVGDPILDETSAPNPLTPYQKSKYRSEQIVSNAFAQSGFPAVVVRPCMIYGPRGLGEFHKFCRLMKKGIFPKVGLGKNLTPLVYVTDVVNGAVLAMEKGTDGEVYLLTSETSISMDDMHKYIMQSLGSKAPYIYVPAWMALSGASVLEWLFNAMGKEPIVTYRNMKSTVVDRTFDIKKAKNELGYMPQVSFEKGIDSTVQWYKEQGVI